MANILFEYPPVSYQTASLDDNPVIRTYLNTIKGIVFRKSTFVVLTLVLLIALFILLLLMITQTTMSNRNKPSVTEYSVTSFTEGYTTHHSGYTVTAPPTITCNISATNATWSKQGLVVVDLLSQCTMGDKQLCLLPDLFIDNINNNLYAVDQSDYRIHKYSLTDSLENGQLANGTVVASEGLIAPSSIFVDTATEDMYILDYDKAKITNPQEPATYRVYLWPKDSNTGRIILQELGEYYYGLYSYLVLDKQKNIYVGTRYHIRKWYASSNYTQVVTVAGTGESGQNTSDQLWDTRGLHIDENLTLYIADWNNHRVQKWLFNSQAGTTLASNLLYVYGVTQDCQGNIYYSDVYQNAVYQINVLTNQTTVVIGDTSGFQNYRDRYISRPFGMKFDKFGNLFVIDGEYSRIKKFTLS